MSERFTVVLEFEAQAIEGVDAPPAVRLRQALKALGRQWKFKCLKAWEVREEGQARDGEGTPQDA